MSMNNEELSIKMAVFENQLSNLVASNTRIEASVEKIASLDRTIAEIVANYGFMSQKLIEVERETAMCSANHARETEKLWLEISTAKDRISHANGVAVTAIWFICGACVVAGSFLTFLFNTANSNKEVNIQQTQQIQQLEKKVN